MVLLRECKQAEIRSGFLPEAGLPVETEKAGKETTPPVGGVVSLPAFSGCRGAVTVHRVGAGVRVKPLPAPFILLLVYGIHDPTGILPAAGSAVQVGWHFALRASFGGGFCGAHKGVGLLMHVSIYRLQRITTQYVIMLL